MGCTNTNSQSSYPSLPYGDAVVWDNKAFSVTEEIVSPDSLDMEIGEVKRYIDGNKQLPEKDLDSTIAPVGSKLFKIKDMNLKEVLAIELNGKFYKAVHSEP
ncbi:NisI/SpaI family lantibiotic immunity lipoprotein [Anaerobacillus isosaccharinicus]|nr:NisI/SpaI family lantibiotic immunity lipoprotein [Anaerobacillus isosaccharinicus]